MSDLDRVIEVMNNFITSEKERLCRENVGDREWDELSEYMKTVNKLELLRCIL